MLRTYDRSMAYLSVGKHWQELLAEKKNATWQIQTRPPCWTSWFLLISSLPKICLHQIPACPWYPQRCRAWPVRPLGGWILVGNTPFLSTNFCGHCVLYILILLIGIEVHLPVCQHAWRKSWLSGTFFLENQSMAARWGNNAEHLGRTPAACPLTVQWT